MTKFYNVKSLLLFGLLLLASGGISVRGQVTSDLSDNLVRYIGFYVFNLDKCKPPNFEKIRWVRIMSRDQNVQNPISDRNGKTLVSGYVETIDDEKLVFRSAELIKNSAGDFEQFEFETRPVGGIHYSFKGAFQKKSVNEGGNYTVLRGTVFKYKNRQLLTSIPMAPFSKYAEL